MNIRRIINTAITATLLTVWFCATAMPVYATAETEPNNTCATANGPLTIPAGTDGLLITGSMNPGTDVDWYQFTISAYADLWFETFDSTGPGSCTPATIDTALQLFRSDCTTAQSAVQVQGGINNCSRLNPTTQPTAMKHLPPGTYALKVYNHGAATYNYTLQAKYVALCGNGVREGSEECDGGATCTADCTLLPVCGNGIIESGEQCDDGNTTDGDGCSSTCQVEATPETEPNNTCGTANGPYAISAGPFGVAVKGNLSASTDQDWFTFTTSNWADLSFQTFDQVSLATCASPLDTVIQLYKSDCITSVGVSQDTGGVNLCAKLDSTTQPTALNHLPAGTYQLKVTPKSGTTLGNYFVQAKYTALCGNGVREGSEECDGGATCAADCTLLAVCGNGIVQSSEQCDDGNTTSGDGCTATCTIEPGYVCSGSPSVCTRPPTFVGSTTTLTVNQNAGATDIRSLLHVSDTDSGQTETWTQYTAPGHGTLTLIGAAASSGSSDITPGGTITYTPATGYNGSDSFAVQVSDGIATATRTISVTVNPTFTVSPSAGANGSITPATPQTVNYNSSTTFTIKPAAGYHVVTPVGGSCGGFDSGNPYDTVGGISYTTNPLTADCTVQVAFRANSTIPPFNGLVAWYPFDSEARDHSGNNNHGTVSGALPAADRFGNPTFAYGFDGIDDYISVPHSSSLAFADGFSASFRVRFNQVNRDTDNYDWQALFTKDSFGSLGLMLCTDSSCRGTLRFYHAGLTPSQTDYNWAAVQPGAWYHVAITYGDGFARHYIDGIQVKETPVTGSLSDNSSKDLFIGRNGTVSYPLDGSLDDVRFYNRALTGDEVQAVYNAQAPIIINNGAPYAASQSVALTLVCPDAGGCSQMQFSGNNSDWSAAEPYADTRAWTLDAGDGVKTVYVKFKDSLGNWTGVFSDDITLDTSAPATVLLSISFAGAGGNKVDSISPDHGINCDKGSPGSGCSASFTTGLPVSLAATPDWKSTFTGWSANAPAGVVTMDSDKTVTATFDPNFKAKLIPGGTLFASIQDAYAGVPSGSMTIQAQTWSFLEDLLFNNGTAVTLTGGMDESYNPTSGYATVKSLTVGIGSAVIGNITIK